MRLCAQGVSRQEAHEQIRVLSHQSGSVVKNEVSRPDEFSSIPPLIIHHHRANRTTSCRGSRATNSSSPSGLTLMVCSRQSFTLVAARRLSRSIAVREALSRRHWPLTRRTSRALALRSLASKEMASVFAEYIPSNVAGHSQARSHSQVEHRSLAPKNFFISSLTDMWHMSLSVYG